VEIRIKEWDLNATQKRRIYDLILQHIEASEEGFEEEKFDFLRKYLSTFSTNDNVSSVKDRVKTLIVDLIKDPNASRIDDILLYPVIAQLKDDATYSKVYRLLEIFAKEGATQYSQLYQQDPAFFTETLGLVHEETLTKIRLLSLLSLAATKEVISYSVASQVTGVDVSEIEALVVEGITRGCLDARLDQLNKNVVVRHAEPRTYDQQHWERLDSRLAKWKTSMLSVVEVIRHAKTQLSAPESS